METDNGTWVGDVDEFTYQWQTVRYEWGDPPYGPKPTEIGTDIPGATGKEYTPKPGEHVRCLVTAKSKES